MKKINLAHSSSTNKKKVQMKELNLNEVKQITGGRGGAGLRPQCPIGGCIVQDEVIQGKVK